MARIIQGFLRWAVGEHTQDHPHLTGFYAAEGVKIRSEKRIAFAVRRQAGNIGIRVRARKNVKNPLREGPFLLRGFRRMGVIIRSVLETAREAEKMQAGDFERGSALENKIARSFNVELSKVWSVMTLIAMVVLTALCFVIVPLGVEYLLKRYVFEEKLWVNVVGGAVRVLLAFWYGCAIMRLRGIRRMMGHQAAGHQAINLFLTGKRMSVEGAKKQPRTKKNSNAAYLMWTLLITVACYSIAATDYASVGMRVGMRLLTIPVVGVLVNEVMYLLNWFSDKKWFKYVYAPSEYFQHCMLPKPGDDMLEIAVNAVKAAEEMPLSGAKTVMPKAVQENVQADAETDAPEETSGEEKA